MFIFTDEGWWDKAPRSPASITAVWHSSHWYMNKISARSWDWQMSRAPFKHLAGASLSNQTVIAVLFFYRSSIVKLSLCPGKKQLKSLRLRPPTCSDTIWFVPSVLRSSRAVRVHAEVPEHRLHGPLHAGVHPQDYCLRSAGELSGPYAARHFLQTPANYLLLHCASVCTHERESIFGYANQPETFRLVDLSVLSCCWQRPRECWSNRFWICGCLHHSETTEINMGGFFCLCKQNNKRSK